MRLNDEQYEEIKRTVIDTFLEYDVKCVPINAFEMATKMGIKVIPYSSLSEKQQDASMRFSKDGYSIETNDSVWKIYYNDSCDNYRRINHTIMHEIGHFALGHVNEGEIEEAEAKFFAKYALAPPPLVHNVCQNVNPVSIMEKFDISFQAAGYAYEYYKSWMRYGGDDYTKYERKMLELFKVA